MAFSLPSPSSLLKLPSDPATLDRRLLKKRLGRELNFDGASNGKLSSRADQRKAKSKIPDLQAWAEDNMKHLCSRVGSTKSRPQVINKRATNHLD